MKKKALIVEDEEQARLYLARMIAVTYLCWKETKRIFFFWMWKCPE